MFGHESGELRGFRLIIGHGTARQASLRAEARHQVAASRKTQGDVQWMWRFQQEGVGVGNCNRCLFVVTFALLEDSNVSTQKYHDNQWHSHIAAGHTCACEKTD